MASSIGWPSRPPGTAKTTYVSHLFPPWYLARNPEHLVLSGIHTQEFAEEDRQKGSQLHRRHNTTLGIELDPTSRSMADWALSSGGGYQAVGVGVAVAGQRATWDWSRTRSQMGGRTTAAGAGGILGVVRR